jgi:hypothetical protein
MSRYEEMDEILEQIVARSGETAPGDRDAGAEVASHVENEYAGAVQAILAVHRKAERVREILTSEYVRSLAPQEHEELLTLLETVLRELSQCEVTLQRVAPYE